MFFEHLICTISIKKKRPEIAKLRVVIKVINPAPFNYKMPVLCLFRFKTVSLRFALNFGMFFCPPGK